MRPVRPIKPKGHGPMTRDMPTCLAFAAHTAHLLPMTGDGLLVLPDLTTDMAPLDGMESLHSADWAHVVRSLDGMGWEPTEGEDGGLSLVGHLADGREVVGLYGRDPITSHASIIEAAEALLTLCEDLAVVPCSGSWPR